MLADIIKFSFIYFCSTYICLKSINQKYCHPILKIGLGIYSLTLSYLTYLLHIYIADLTYTGPLLLLWIVISLITLRPQESFVAMVLGFGMSYILYALSSFTALIVISPIYYSQPYFPHLMLAIISVVLQTLLTISIFRIKRFRNGMPFLFATHVINFATIICLILIAFLLYVSSEHSDYWIKAITPILFVLVLAFIIHWWQSQITKSYKRALLLRELESLRTELQEKDKLISDLTKQNEQLGRLIHKDNKLIPALENAVCDYLISDFTDSRTTIDRGNALLLEVRNFSNSRSNIISEIHANKCKQFSTGISSLNTLLNYMEKRAKQDNITFSVHIAFELKNYIPHTISSDDLVHLLSDLLENSFIATAKNQERIVQLQFYQSQKNLVIEVADNGIPFELTSFANLGISQLTTHADTGGSGIGLMDIWKIKEAYGASLHIAEYETPTPYAKKISLIFNKKNQYSIETWRKDKIEQISKRSDLLIYDYKIES